MGEGRPPSRAGGGGRICRHSRPGAEAARRVDDQRRSADIGKGYDVGKNQYLVMDDEELEAVQIESTHTIEIDRFVPKKEIDQRYLDRPYYIAPGGDKVGEEAFAVIRDAMKDTDRVALGRIVLARREHVMAIEPMGKGMLGTSLRYPYELREEKPFFADVRSPRVPRETIELARHILESKAGHFDPSEFEDEYETALKALVRRKAKGHTIEVPEERPEASNVINLMDALRQSLKGERRGGKSRPNARRPARRRSAAKGRHRKAA